MTAAKPREIHEYYPLRLAEIAVCSGAHPYKGCVGEEKPMRRPLTTRKPGLVAP